MVAPAGNAWHNSRHCQLGRPCQMTDDKWQTANSMFYALAIAYWSFTEDAGPTYCSLFWLRLSPLPAPA